MANQRAPSIDTVEEITVEKIVLSGSQMVSSVLGHGAHVITAASVPLFYRDPIISGSVYPISVLSCEAESFTSSPRAVITYQWKRNTVNISEETNQTFITAVSGVDDEITCEVTITNASGSDVVVSNGITLVATTDTKVTQLDTYALTGWAAPSRIDMVGAFLLVVSGMVHARLETVMALEAYILTGLTVSTQTKVVAVELYTIFLDPPA